MIAAESIARSFGGVHVLKDISFRVEAGERRGLIGPNGAGKTTLLNILCGLDKPTAGHVKLNGRDVTGVPNYRRGRLGLGRTFQIANLFDERTVRENIVLALVAREGYAKRFLRPLSSYSALGREAEDLMERWSLRESSEIPVGELSYGDRRLVELVLALAGKPTVLLLDEPAAGLSGQETTKILEAIVALDPSLAILLVEHDMELVFGLCERITVIADGYVLAEGTADEIRSHPDVIEAYLGMSL